MECLLDDVLTGRQEMMGAIDAVCDSARRIIGKLAARGDDGETLVPGDAPGGADRPPTAAMRKYAAAIAKRKGIKPPRGYTKSAAVCRAFLDRHGPGQKSQPDEGARAGGPAPGASTGGKPGNDEVARSGRGARSRPVKPRQRRKSQHDKTGASAGGPQSNDGSPTPLRIPYGNKELAFGLGARYGADGWYAPLGVDLDAFRERGWL